MKELIEIQNELKAPKNLRNSFGNYNYRNLEGILEAVKPLLKKHNCTLVISDDVIECGIRIYVRATATITNKDGLCVSATALARESEVKKGMDDSQITGTASSYARKYCLNGLFLIDDTKDADTDEYRNQLETAKAGDKTISAQNARNCKKLIEETGSDTKKILEYINNKFGNDRKSIDDINVEEFADVMKNLEKKLGDKNNG